MRSRLALVLTVLLVALCANVPLATASTHRVLAQEGTGGTDAQSEDATQTDGEGQSGADAETGAGEEAQQPVEQEEGPPWTYQMAKITLALLFLVFLGMGISYWKLIGSRQRGAA